MEDILTIFNPWWKTGKVKKELSCEFRRDLFSEIVEFLSTRQIIALFGLRRTGKSTILFQLIEEFIKREVEPERILYFSFDEKVAEIKDIFSAYSQIHDLDLEDGKYYLFLDEVQKLEDWQNKLKIFYDMYPNMKFFISGSSHLALRKKASESMAGRINFFKLEPLSFREWLTLNDFEFNNKKISLYKRELRSYFNWYIKTPFPEIAKLREDILIKKYIDEFIISRVISYDIKKEFKNVDTDLLETLKDLFFEEIGFILNVDGLAEDLHRGKETILKHINYLVQGLIIKILRNYRGSRLSSSRKLRRVYPYHPCFCLGASKGRYMENLFVSALDAEFYWREKEKEIDIIKNKTPVEVKYKNTVRRDDLKNTIYFMKKFGQRKGFVVTKDSEGEREYDSNRIELIPAWKFLLQDKSF